MNKKQDITSKLQSLVKKKNTPLVVLKAGSVKHKTRQMNKSIPLEEYYSGYSISEE